KHQVEGALSFESALRRAVADFEDIPDINHRPLDPEGQYAFADYVPGVGAQTIRCLVPGCGWSGEVNQSGNPVDEWIQHAIDMEEIENSERWQKRRQGARRTVASAFVKLQAPAGSINSMLNWFINEARSRPLADGVYKYY